MARSIVAVIASYLTMFVLGVLVIVFQFALLGAGFAFEPGSFETSNQWIVLALMMSLMVAVAGGYICATISRGGKAPLALAILVFVLGLASAIPVLYVPPSAVVRQSDDIPMFEAMSKARQPRWVPFTFPVLGVAGVVVGAKLKKRLRKVDAVAVSNSSMRKTAT